MTWEMPSEMCRKKQNANPIKSMILILLKANTIQRRRHGRKYSSMPGREWLWGRISDDAGFLLLLLCILKCLKMKMFTLGISKMRGRTMRSLM